MNYEYITSLKDAAIRVGYKIGIVFMLANRILNILLGIAAIIVVPLQFITTFVLGILVSISYGILLLPITFLWVLLLFPMIGVSWLTSKMAWLRIPVGLLGIPWAIVADTYVALMPSMGEIENRAAKFMLIQSWPYSWECWRFQIGKAYINDPDNWQLGEVIRRVSRGNLVMETTVAKIAAGEALDSNV